MSADPDAVYCFTNEAAHLLGANPSTVKMWYRTGRLPGRRFGAHLVFERAVIHEYAERHGPFRPGAKPQPDSVSGKARAAGINPHTVHSRLRLGWLLERALTTPVVRKAKAA